ncbi:MAG: hypothetical protein ACUVV0_11570 [Anaerolineae bacterium]
MKFRLRNEFAAWIVSSIILLFVLSLAESFVAGAGIDFSEVRLKEYYKTPTPTAKPAKFHFFKAEPDTINEGEAAVLSWDVERATEVYLYPGGENGVVAPGVMVVYPTTTTTYILKVCNKGNCFEKKVTVHVRRKPQITFFEANPPGIVQGRATTLSWNVADATEAYLNGEPVSIPSGSKQVAPASTTNYTLVARSAIGQTEKTITVNVRPRPYIRFFTANPPVVDQGQRAILSWSVSGAAEAYLNGEPVSVPEGTKEVAPMDTTIYILVARNEAGEAQMELTVNVNPTPTPVPLKVFVVDENERPLAGVEVFRPGPELHGPGTVSLGRTDGNGYMPLGPEFPITLYAEILAQTIPSPKHEWAYKVYRTSQVETVYGPGEVKLKVNRSLVGFNLFVSIEWDADADYVNQLKDGLLEASRRLFRATEGQIFFEEIHIFDNGGEWNRADLRVHATSRGLPKREGGFIEEAGSYIYLPRYWGTSPLDGRCCQAESGPWNQEIAFQEIIRQFGGYGLHLNREQLPNSFDLLGFCIWDKCLMKGSGEFFCENCWGALQEIFNLRLPERRAKNLVVPAPVPILPFTVAELGGAEATGEGVRTVEINVSADLRGRMPFLLPKAEVIRQAGPPLNQGWVALSCQPPCPEKVFSRITLVGVSEGDVVHFYIPQEGWSKGASVGEAAGRGFEIQTGEEAKLPVEPALVFPAEGSNGLLVLIPVRGQIPNPPAARIAGQELSAPLDLSYKGEVIIPSEGASPTGAYEGFLSLPELKPLQGIVEVRALDEKGRERTLISSFSVGIVTPERGGTLFSREGALQVDVPPGAIGERAAAVIGTTRLPALPEGERVIVGDVFSVELPKNILELSAPATLIMRYPPELATFIDLDSLAIQRWNVEAARWEELESGSRVDREHRAVIAQTNRLSHFALVAKRTFEIPTLAPTEVVSEAMPPKAGPEEVQKPASLEEIVISPAILYISVAIMVLAFFGLIALFVIYLARRRAF